MTALRKRIRIFGPDQQQGAALVIAVLILLILTVVGIYAVTTATLETKISGNERLMKEAFYSADGGIDYGRQMIELTLDNDSLPGGANPHNDDDDVITFQNEVRGFDDDWDVTYIDDDASVHKSPYLEPEIGNCDAVIQVDRIKLVEQEGGSAAWGGPASERRLFVYYRIDSVSEGVFGASSRIQGTYIRRVQ